MSWREDRLGNVVTLKRGHDLPESARQDGTVPVVSSSGITGFHNVAKAEPPGVVTGRYGTLGEVFYLDQPYWPLNTALYAIDFHGNDPRFVAYFLRLALKGTKSDKAAVPGVNRNDLHERKVRVPDLPSQLRIVGLLRQYDDLIQNNRRRIKLLEEAARLIYREWFVRLRFPGHEHTMIENGVPEGWQRVPFGEAIAFHIGGGWGEDDHTADSTEPAYVIRGTDFPSVESGDLQDVGLRFHRASTLPSRILIHGDIIFEVSGGSVSQPIARSIYITERLLRSFDKPVICASFCKRFMPRQPVQGLLLHMHLKEGRSNGQVLVYQKQSASALQNLNFAAFIESFNVLLPDEGTLTEFGEIVYPVYDEMTVLAKQIASLKRARDVLLPRLMSGEVRV